jgi:hypothetical protein
MNCARFADDCIGLPVALSWEPSNRSVTDAERAYISLLAEALTVAAVRFDTRVRPQR